ncbi:MAG: flagellin N-terminal helical domain-containing protein [Candidatus Krumholzibacteriia bacterium]
MGLRVNTNVASINAQRSLMVNTTLLGKSLEKLSSGLRINRAGDDAAGLAISESLKSDIRALQQASRNAADGISMIQTAEGGLEEVSGILIRMRELAEQAATGTLGSDERAYLDSEFQQLVLEVTRIADSTEFNGTKLLDGSIAQLDIQVGVGTQSDSQVTLQLGAGMRADDLNLDTVNILDADAALAAITAVSDATGLVSAQRADFGSAQNRLESTIRNIAMSVENLSAANSRIRDVDIAAETSAMTAMQILQQAGVAVLAQANATPQLALQLLQR